LHSIRDKSFHQKVRLHIPGCLKAALEPLLEMIEQLTRQIRQYDLQIEQLCQQKYPETQHLQQIRGVGRSRLWPLFSHSRLPSGLEKVTKWERFVANSQMGPRPLDKDLVGPAERTGDSGKH